VKTTHTPGPLRVLQNHKDAPTQFLVVADAPELVALARVGREADAVLFSAAPELLAALKALLCVTDLGDGNQAEFDAAEAAIAKAEGEP
jgi:hypothetical protein